MSSAPESVSTAQIKPRMGFLEKLYLDRFDKSLFKGLSFPEPDSKAQDIISRYREIIENYAPAELERKAPSPKSSWTA